MENENNLDSLVREACIHTPEYNKFQEDDLSSNYISLFLLAFDEYIKGHLQNAFDNLEIVRGKAMNDRQELLNNHDCHLSQDSGCKGCEEVEEYNFIIKNCEKLMKSIDDKSNN